MANYNVSSMVQFINALTSLTDGDTIDVNADLDYNDVFLDTQESIRVPTAGYATNCTINGNNHAIYNFDNTLIRQGTNIFNVYAQHLRVNNLSFLNCNMTKAGSVFNFQFANNEDIIFNTGVLQGRFVYAPISCYANSVLINNYMITFTQSKAQLAGQTATNSPRFRFCWINFDNCELRDISGSRFILANLDTCYVKGLIKASTGDFRYFGGALSDCCFNVTLGNGHDIQSLDTIFGTQGDMLNIINADKLNTAEPLESTSHHILVTDTQMHDAEYLASIGFNIVS